MPLGRRVLSRPAHRSRRNKCCLLVTTKKQFVSLLFSVFLASSIFFRLKSQRLLDSLENASPSIRLQEPIAANNLPLRTPSHGACAASNIRGIYHVAMGDIGGAAGTIFFQFVVAQIMYAEQHNLKPWVHFSNVSHVIYDESVHGKGLGVLLTSLTGRNASYVRRKGGHRFDATPGPPDSTAPIKRETLHFEGTGVWDHYFEPVSDFVPGDLSCQDKLYVTMDLYLITPGLHGYAEYAPRCWRYKYLPDYISKPHLGITEWLEPQRRAAHDVVKRYIRPRQHLRQAAETVNPGCELQRPCLGLHIRHSDKASGRRVIETKEFLPFVQAFLSSAGNHASVYLATDSDLVLDEIKQSWPALIQQRIRTAGSNILRSSDQGAVFDLDGASQHHRVNEEVLIEILALANCQFMVHGHSAVSESSIWLNIDLHDASVNLEDDEHVTADLFKQLVHSKMSMLPRETWPHPVTTKEVWPALSEEVKVDMKQPTHEACNGYSGVLWINSVGSDSSTINAFFTSVLNQLLFAEMNNLKPWVHLQPGAPNNLIYDDTAHDPLRSSVDIEVLSAGLVPRATSNGLAVAATLDQDLSVPRKEHIAVKGNGIWESYFKPVSDFTVGDRSCAEKPFVQFPASMVDLTSLSPWSVKAWRYNELPDHLSWNESVPLSMWADKMRIHGSDLTKKYFSFHPHLTRRASEVNPIQKGEVCLGVHLRNGEKRGKHREKISPKEFVPYIQAFVDAGGRHIFVASDSHRAIQYLKKNIPGNILELIRMQGEHVVRSTKLDWPLHYIEKHHRVNSEALADLLALSKCSMLLHGFSTLSEAAIYLNPELRRTSINLEDPDRIPPAEFSALAAQRITAHP